MADSGFVIDGIIYEVPALDSFTMGEAKILYLCSGLSLEDFAVDEEDAEASARLKRNVRNPGFIEALMRIAYLRGNPGITDSKAESVVSKANLVEALSTFVEVDAVPPESKTPVGAASSASPSEPSGVVSTNGSAEPAASLLPTGTSESDTSQDRDLELLKPGSRQT